VAPKASGSFVQTLVLTDIATGWTECAPLLVREQGLRVEVLTEMREHLPFAVLGFDTDNDSVFMNETVQEYCRIAGVEFTRCRPYRKNDQAWVGSSRRTARLCAAWSAIGGSKGWRQRPHSPISIRECGCS